MTERTERSAEKAEKAVQEAQTAAQEARDVAQEARNVASRGKTRERRFALAIAAAVIGALLIAAASVAISVTLDAQLRAESDCRADARNLEFDGLRIEMGATTALLGFAIEHPNRTEADTAAAVVTYQKALVQAQRLYTDAERKRATC